MNKTTAQRLCETIEGMIGCDPIDPKELSDPELMERLKMDSLDMVELVMAVEEDFNIAITDDEVEAFRPTPAEKQKPMSDLVKLIDSKLSEKAI